MTRLPAAVRERLEVTPILIDPATGWPADTAVDRDPDTGLARVVFRIDGGRRSVPTGLSSADIHVACRAARELRPDCWR